MPHRFLSSVLYMSASLSPHHKVFFFEVDVINTKTPKLANTQKISDCRVRSPEWGIYIPSILPRLRVQHGRRWKSLRARGNGYLCKIVFVRHDNTFAHVISQMVHCMHKNYTQSSQPKYPVWMKKELMKSNFYLSNHWQLMASWG